MTTRSAKEAGRRIATATAPEIADLVRTVREYESDTFSASASRLTHQEAICITQALIHYALEQLIDLETLDGVRITEELENIRD